MEYLRIENWTGKGHLLVTKTPVAIQVGENYIGRGFAGDNVFTAQSKSIIACKVIAVSKDLEWGITGNNTLNALPKIEF